MLLKQRCLNVEPYQVKVHLQYSYILMRKSWLITIITLYFQLAYTLRDSTVPKRLGLLTVTHERTPDNQFFKQYLQKYAEMDCDIIQQISIVWNNNYTVESSGILDLKSNWKIPVYFHENRYNSMAYRFNLPKQSKVQVFFVIDDDIDINCIQLKNGFQTWKRNAVDNISPLTGYGEKSASINISVNTFVSHTGYTEYYTFVLVGVEYVSRQYLNFFNSYYLQSRAMLQLCRDVKNCDDLMINYLIGKYYPYFVPIIIKQVPWEQGGFFKLASGPHGVSDEGYHYRIRHMCVRVFSEMLGYMSVYINRKDKQVIQKMFWKLPKQFNDRIVQVAARPVRRIMKNANFQHQTSNFKLLEQKLTAAFKKNNRKFQQSLMFLIEKNQQENQFLTSSALQTIAINMAFLGLNSSLITLIITLKKRFKQKATKKKQNQ